MHSWLKRALAYIPEWVSFQMRVSEQPGCVIAVAHRRNVVLEQAFGYADLATGEPLTSRHRFRVASHSKSFTAAGILRLREQGRLSLDDQVRKFVPHLNPEVGRSTIAQLLSHSAGLVRDGGDDGQFADRRPFLNREEVFAELENAPVIEANTRFKYSNLGYSLLGMVIEVTTDEAYAKWIKREIVDKAGLEETEFDMPLGKGIPFMRGHTGRLVLGRRLTIPGDFSTNAIAPAGGFVSTAADLARFFAQLSPNAKKSVLSKASRREMVRRQWRDPHAALERYYGLGTICGTKDGWGWFGHSGGLQGYISNTRTLPDQDLTISVLTNAADGWAGPWLDGATHIFQIFARHGAPSRQVKDWTGRWWSLGGAVDLVPMGDRVMVANPAMWLPFLKASEIEARSRTEGRIAMSGGYGSFGEPVRCKRKKSGEISGLWLAASELVPEADLAKEMIRRYEPASAAGSSQPRKGKRSSRSDR